MQASLIVGGTGQLTTSQSRRYVLYVPVGNIGGIRRYTTPVCLSGRTALYVAHVAPAAPAPPPPRPLLYGMNLEGGRHEASAVHLVPLAVVRPCTLGIGSFISYPSQPIHLPVLAIQCMKREAFAQQAMDVSATPAVCYD